MEPITAVDPILWRVVEAEFREALLQTSVGSVPDRFDDQVDV